MGWKHLLSFKNIIELKKVFCLLVVSTMKIYGKRIGVTIITSWLYS